MSVKRFLFAAILPLTLAIAAGAQPPKPTAEPPLAPALERSVEELGKLKKARTDAAAAAAKADADAAKAIAAKETEVKRLIAELKAKLAAQGIDLCPPPVPVPPKPPPDPPVPAPKPLAVKHLTFVGATVAEAAVVNDAGLRAWLKERGIAVHVLAASAELPAGFADPVRDAGGAPCFVLQFASGKIAGADTLKGQTVEDIKDAVESVKEGK